MNFSAHAHWIWNNAEASPRNFWLRLRRAFHCPTQIKRASLLITADSRYELYINAHDLGNGPIRSFPWSYSYDDYDVTSWLRSGEENVLAARVVHWGDYTFQSIRARAGFLCELVLELSDGQVERIGSDESWLISPDPAFVRNTPRISIQLPFEEQYDARSAEDGWTAPGYSTSSWQQAVSIGSVGISPWQELVPRTIPFLTRDVVTPIKVLALEIARLSPGYRWSFDVRHRVKNPATGLHAETHGTRGCAFATEILVPHACRVILTSTNNHDYQWTSMTCNGRPVAEALELQEGRNLFVIKGTDWPAVYLQTPQELTFDATRIVPDVVSETDAVWAYLGPFDERDDTYQRITSASDITQLPIVRAQIIPASENLEDVFLQTRSQHYLLPENGFCDPGIAHPQPRTHLTRPLTPLAEQSANFLHQNTDYTLLYPQQEGDVHLIVDFGREVCGFPVLELDAPEGTIVDANFFEGIDESGIFWTDGLRNSFRYVCRAGYQIFRSHQRRGFRYASLTFRFPANTDAPIKLYNVRCLLNTYPVEQRGSFSCSDALLTNIWEVAAYTVRLCMEDTYVDCPAYEQVFWVGDARNSALVNAVAFGANELTDRCLRLVAQSLSHNLDSIKPPQLQKRAHLTTDHVGSGWFSEIPMWTFLWIWNVWEHYLITADRVALAELYPAVRECLERCLRFLSPRGLLNVPDVWNLVDWSAMDLTRDGEVTSSNALLVESLRRAALMAEALVATGSASTTSLDVASLQHEVLHYREAAARISTAINTYCWSEERGAYVDTVRDEQAYIYHQALAVEYGLHLDEREQFLARMRISEHTNTLVLLCNCASEERVERILPLVEAAKYGKFIGSSPDQAVNFPPDEIVPVGSPWFLFFTLEALLKRHEVATVITLICEQWGRMLAQGATTFWETFPNLHATHWSRSLCHGWSAAPAYFLSTQVLGVQLAAPGYSRVRIAPYIGDLNWAKGIVPTLHGDIYISWSRQGETLEIALDIPTNVVAELLIEEITGQLEYIGGVQGEIVQQQGQWRVIFPHGGFARYRVGLIVGEGV